LLPRSNSLSLFFLPFFSSPLSVCCAGRASLSALTERQSRTQAVSAGWDLSFVRSFLTLAGHAHRASRRSFAKGRANLCQSARPLPLFPGSFPCILSSFFFLPFLLLACWQAAGSVGGRERRRARLLTLPAEMLSQPNCPLLASPNAKKGEDLEP
jgi:hypothetical protein